ncbi:MAG TPA: hypothetical protein EYP09_00830, partial [Anaerolineae bacterium]|nr:hypothetical protein [Anaerolineae bacterium]
MPACPTPTTRRLTKSCWPNTTGCTAEFPRCEEAEATSGALPQRKRTRCLLIDIPKPYAIINLRKGLQGVSLRILRRPFPAEWILLLAVTIVAAALRFYAIGRLPPGLYHDEAFNGLDALRVLEGERPIFFPANNGREPLFIYLVALSVAALGRSPGAIRIVAAVLGTLTVPAAHLMAKAMFDRRVGLATAAVTAITLWHVNLSRI